MTANLEKVRQACIAANKAHRDFRDCQHCGEGGEIRLADVLLAMQNTNASLVFYGDDKLCILEPRNRKAPGRKSTTWNLREDDLSKQSEETVAFIASLLP
jgi:hypothetical protein